MKQPLRTASRATHSPVVAAVIPCYRVARHVLGVLGRIGPDCSHIYVVDDACPEHSGDVVEAGCLDPRVKVIRHRENEGVGAAVITGYRAALADGAHVVVKIDGDGQMAPELLPDFVGPILAGQADYTKGNRFYDLASIGGMPAARTFGNAALSFMAKLSCGYWDVFDPTNGYTAVHANVLRHLPLDTISKRYFFETDMLFRLGTIRAVVVDIPMDAHYGDESSSLRVSRVFGEFLYKHARNTVKRIFYNYFLRDFTIASVELVIGLILFVFGATYGIVHWTESAREDVATPPGTVMLAALPVLMGLQLLLAFIGYDVAATPKRVIHPLLRQRGPTASASRGSVAPSDASARPLSKDEGDGVGRQEPEERQER
jgi:dolichol-phosphate mannosyltransferase